MLFVKLFGHEINIVVVAVYRKKHAKSNLSSTMPFQSQHISIVVYRQFEMSRRDQNSYKLYVHLLWTQLELLGVNVAEGLDINQLISHECNKAGIT